MRAFCSDTDKVILDILAEQWFLVYSSSGQDIHLRNQQLRQVGAKIDELPAQGRVQGDQNVKVAGGGLFAAGIGAKRGAISSTW